MFDAFIDVSVSYQGAGTALKVESLAIFHYYFV